MTPAAVSTGYRMSDPLAAAAGVSFFIHLTGMLKGDLILYASR